LRLNYWLNYRLYRLFFGFLRFIASFARLIRPLRRIYMLQTRILIISLPVYRFNWLLDWLWILALNVNWLHRLLVRLLIGQNSFRTLDKLHVRVRVLIPVLAANLLLVRVLIIPLPVALPAVLLLIGVLIPVLATNVLLVRVLIIPLPVTLPAILLLIRVLIPVLATNVLLTRILIVIAPVALPAVLLLIGVLVSVLATSVLLTRILIVIPPVALPAVLLLVRVLIVALVVFNYILRHGFAIALRCILMQIRAINVYPVIVYSSLSWCIIYIYSYRLNFSVSNIFNFGNLRSPVINNMVVDIIISDVIGNVICSIIGNIICYIIICHIINNRYIFYNSYIIPYYIIVDI